MWKRFIVWLHHLFNPHCNLCALLEEEKTECKSCYVYREQLDLAGREKMKLLEVIMELNSKKLPESIGQEKDYKPITPRFVPWHLERARLEKESRIESENLRRQKEPLEDVEKLEELVLGDTNGLG